MISLEQAGELVWHALDDMEGGEIYVKQLPSTKLTDLARALVPDARHEIVGIRPGEKVYEQMIGAQDSVGLSFIAQKLGNLDARRTHGMLIEPVERPSNAS